MFRCLSFLLVYFTGIFILNANCDCPTCPEQLNSGILGGVISQIEISGATNPTIGVNGQGLRSVRLHLVHASLEEIDVILSKGGPFNFSRLIEQNGNSTSDTVTLDICFINCDEIAEPDPGFPATFDSGAGYGSNQIYTGSYFPSQGINGCFNSSFDGISVNGTWQLAISGSPSFGGELVSWELDFYDNDGTVCEPFCVTPLACDPNGGEIIPSQLTACEGSASLDFDIPVDFDGNEPDPNFYDYFFVVTDEDEVIIDFAIDPNLSSFDPGTYFVCGLSVLAADFSLVPDPDGSFSLSDLQNDIDEEIYCAELSDGCWTIIIIEDDSDPQISGPTEACIGELNTFTLEGLPIEDWTGANIEGPFLELEFDLPDIFVSWGPGPSTRTICYSYDNACGSGEVCITVDIIQPPNINVSGPLNVCEDSPYIYDLEPSAPPGSSWEITIEGGILVDQNDDSFEVEWFENSGVNTATVVLIDGPCGDSDPITIGVNFISPAPLEIELFSSLCLNQIGQASVDFDPLINNYSWFGTGISILSGQGTSGPVEFSIDETGSVELCVEAETSCGFVDAVCEIIEVLVDPEPPQISGPLVVCSGESVSFFIDNYDPDLDYQINITQGSFSQLFVEDDEIVITLIGGPAEICIISENFCGESDETCLSIEVEGDFDPVEVEGTLLVCEGTSYLYELTPSAPPGTFWEVTPVGGTLVNLDGDSFEVEWFENAGENTAAIILVDPNCGNSDPIFFEVELAIPDPVIIQGPLAICLNEIGFAEVNPDPLIVSYNWFGTGISITSGQGTNGPVGFSADELGAVELCVEIETNCNQFETFCETIQVENPPSPVIEAVDPQCELEFTLIGETSPGSSAIWAQVGGPPGASILNPTQPTTEVMVIQSGTYLFELLEDNGLCAGSAEIELVILEAPEVTEGDIFCAGGQYQIQLILSGGIQPYFVDGEEISGSEFLSPEIPSGESYSFIISDANGCETIAEGLIECPCISDAGTMSQDLLVACISTGEAVTASSDGNAVFDVNDIGVFVLHDLPANVLGTIIDSNSSGEFSFQAGMIPGQIYYISFVVGTELNGSFDPNDPCLSVAAGQAVVFYDDPEVEILPLGPLCNLGTLEALVSADVTDVFWSNVSGPGIVDILSPDQVITDVEFGLEGTYVFSIIATNPACSMTEEVEVEVLEPITIADLEINCQNLFEFFVTFSISGGDGEYFVDPAGTLVGNEFASEVLDPDQSYFFTVEDGSGCTNDFVVGPIDCLCDNDAGSMSQELLSACISQGETVAAEYNGDGLLEPGDVSTFVLHDNPGPDLGNVFDTNEDGIFAFIAGMIEGELYYISHVVGSELNGSYDPDDPCLQVSVGQPVVFYGDPVFELIFEDIVCGFESEFEVVTASMLDFPSWEALSWPGDEPPLIVEPNGLISGVEVIESGNYQFVLQLENPACLLRDTFALEFLNNPTISTPVINCISSDLFEVSFEITDSESAFEIDLPGVLEGNVFTSDLLADSILYEFTVVDSLGCESIFSLGPVDCNCVSVPGSMASDTLFFCETGGLVMPDFNDDGFAGLLDTSLWVVHQGSGSELVNPVFFTDQLNFELPDTLETGQLYYVSHIVTSLNEDGEPDFQSSCLRVSPGQPLFVFELPAFALPGDIETCLGPLEILISNGNSGTLELLTNTTGNPLSIELAGDLISVIPESAGSISVVYTESNGLCELSDTLEISFLELPEFTDISVECSGDQFAVSFGFAQGNEPYIVNGDTILDVTFVSDFFPSEDLTEFILFDSRGCQADTLRITENCDCENEAGEIEQAELELCEGENLDVSLLNLTGVNVPDEFGLVYLLLDDPEPDLSSVVQTSSGPDIEWIDGLETNRPYYLIVAVAPLENGELDFSDPCLAFSNFASVIWRSLPEISLNGMAEICEGDEVQMMIEVNGSLPVDMLLQNNFGDQIEATIESDVELLNYSPERLGEELWEIVEVDSDCPAIVEGTFSVLVSEPLTFFVLEAPPICNNTLFGSILDLNALLDQPIQGSWSFEGELLEDGLIDFDGFEQGSYDLEFSTIGFEEPCPGQTVQLTLQVEECECPNLVFPERLEVCADIGEWNLSDIFAESAEGEWSLIIPDGVNSAPELSGNLLEFAEDNEGDFTLVFTLTDSLPEECPSVWEIDLTVEAIGNSGLAADLLQICEGSVSEIDLQTLIFNSDEGGLWLDETGNVIDSIFDAEDLAIGENKFTYIVTGEICASSETNVFIVLNERPEVNVESQDPLCFGEEDGLIFATIVGEERPGFSLILNGEDQGDLIATNLRAGTYEVLVRDDLGCLSDEITIVLFEADSFTVNIGNDLEVDPGELLELEAETNVPDDLLNSVVWTFNGEPLNSRLLSVEFSPSSSGQLEITATNLDGCSTFDAIFITLSERTLFIPNVFRPSGDIAPNISFGPFGTDGVQRILSFNIFDRWGNRVHNVADVKPENSALFWDGMVDDRKAPEGVYVYSLVYEDIAGKIEVRAGDVLLIR
ncbi:MAG: hypothetical protein EA409_11995 [Saprospirales bacterium]|nr:MAG: hypothetical protein EA409_11995 [Saprospirales bacterium]